MRTRAVWLALFSAVLLVVLSSIPGYAVTPCWALQSPLLLDSVGAAPTVYTSYTLPDGQLVLAFSEYDHFAAGHGALVLQLGCDDTNDIVSFIGTRNIDFALLGFSLHRQMAPDGSWLMDFGTSLQAGAARVRFTGYSLPFTNWEQLKAHRKLSLGISLDLLNRISLGGDVYLDQSRIMTGYVSVAMAPTAGARVLFDYPNRKQGLYLASWDVWYRTERLLLAYGYTQCDAGLGHSRMSIGFTF